MPNCRRAGPDGLREHDLALRWQTVSAQDVNCGAGVLGGAVLGGLAGNQIGGGTGQDVATAAGATIGGLLGATRRECQPQAYGQPVYRQPVYPQPVYGQPGYGQPVLIGYDATAGRSTAADGPGGLRAQGHFATGGSDISTASGLCPVSSPKRVPRS